MSEHHCFHGSVSLLMYSHDRYEDALTVHLKQQLDLNVSPCATVLTGTEESQLF